MKSLTLTLPEADISIIADALMDRPFRQVAPTLGRLQVEVARANAPAPQDTPAPDEPEAPEGE